MEFEENKTVPPLYPAELLERYFQKNRAEQMVRMKIEMYRDRHKGNHPARIFVSLPMLMDIVGCAKCNYQTMATRENRLFGIPVSIISDDGEPRIYLSDEEE